MTIKGYLILALCAALALSIWCVFTLLAENAQTKQNLAINQATTTLINKSLVLNAGALAKREIEVEQLTQDKQDLLGELDELYSMDREAGTWAATPIPDSILSRLR